VCLGLVSFSELLYAFYAIRNTDQNYIMPLLGYSNLNKLKSVCSFKWLQEEFSAVTSIFSILRATLALASSGGGLSVARYGGRHTLYFRVLYPGV